MTDDYYYDPLKPFLDQYKKTFCTFDLSSDNTQRALDNIESALNPILQTADDDEYVYDLTTTKHCDISMFPNAYIPNMPYKPKRITPDSTNPGFYDAFPPIFADNRPTCSSNTLHDDDEPLSVPIMPHPNIDRNLMVFGITTEGRVITRDAIEQIYDNAVKAREAALALRPAISIESIEDIEAEMAEILKTKLFINTHEELDNIYIRFPYLKQYYIVMGEIMSHYIQLWLLYKDSERIIPDRTYYTDSDRYINAESQAKFAFEAYVVLYTELRHFNQDIDDIFLAKPFKLCHFILSINERLQLFITTLKQLTYVFCYYISKPYRINKEILTPLSKVSQINHGPTTFSTLSSLLSKNIDKKHYHDFLQDLDNLDALSTSKPYVFYRYFK